MVETSKDTHNSPAEIQGSSQPMPPQSKARPRLPLHRLSVLAHADRARHAPARSGHSPPGPHAVLAFSKHPISPTPKIQVLCPRPETFPLISYSH